MLGLFWRSLSAVVLGTVIMGVIYPLLLSGIGLLFFSYEAKGSLILQNGKQLGSDLIGQTFSDPSYLAPRPSAAGPRGYDATASSGSNLTPESKRFKDLVRERAAAYRIFNKVPPDTLVPVDAVTASGSGLDPEISLENALLQAKRIATVRDISEKQVRNIIRDHSVRSIFDRLGERSVNVLECNLAIDSFTRNIKFEGEQLLKE